MTDLVKASTLANISAEDWDSLFPSNYPFVSHAFLSTLEETQCVGGKSGWLPNYLLKRNNQGDLIGALPAYLKLHSYGEYVFDWSWADAYARYGLNYYPKLFIGAPFTPTTGPRILGETPDLTDSLNKLCREDSLSGWHLTFPTPQDQEVLKSDSKDAPQQRLACQFHWFNRDYDSFEHYLSSFVSRKRKNLNKERRCITNEGIELKRLTGSDIKEEYIAFFYQCYLDTYQKRYSTPYLNEDFFQRLVERMAAQMLLIIAERSGHPCASALCFFDEDTLYGRYWGCIEDHNSLHFEACYYQGIEFCIERGLQRFDPGTQGEHKISRGFEPVLTSSYHWLSRPEFQQAVGDFVRQETPQILQYQKDAAQLLPFRKEAD